MNLTLYIMDMGVKAMLEHDLHYGFKLLEKLVKRKRRFYLDMVFHRPKFIQVVINLHRILNAAMKEVFFDRQKHKYIRRGHQEENPITYREYTKGP